MSVFKAPQWKKDDFGDSKQKKSKDNSNGILEGKIHKKYKKSKLKMNKKIKEDRVQKYRENSAKQHTEISQVNKVSISSIKNKLNGENALHKKKKKRKKSKLNSSFEMQSRNNEAPNGISSVKSNNDSKNNSKLENKNKTSTKNMISDNKNQDKSLVNKKKIKKQKKRQVKNQNSYNSNHQNGIKVRGDVSNHSTSYHSNIENNNNNNKQLSKKYPQIENSNFSERTAVNNVIKPVIQRDDKKKQQLKTKLQLMLAQKSDTSKVEKKQPTLRERMMEKLKAARFRYLNEQMYSHSGKEAEDLFKKDPDSFEAYHEGYQQQVKKWPLNPVDVIIKSLKKMPKTHVIADLGCGDATISKSVEQAVHSFDLVAINDLVTACDMANTPLTNDSVDVAVFCLSLMGTNLHDYLLEANRILKIGGIMKIAEVESRFDNIESFIQIVERFGFKSMWKDLSHNLFYFLDFRKVQHVKNKKKVPSVSLKPCIYKKR